MSLPPDLIQDKNYQKITHTIVKPLLLKSQQTYNMAKLRLSTH